MQRTVLLNLSKISLMRLQDKKRLFWGLQEFADWKKMTQTLQLLWNETQKDHPYTATGGMSTVSEVKSLFGPLNLKYTFPRNILKRITRIH